MNRLIFCWLMLSVLMSCSDNKDDRVKVLLLADKAKILADGEDAVNFRVFDGVGNELTAETVIKVDGKKISGTAFSTEEVGNFVVVGVYKNISSNELTITSEEVIPLNRDLEVRTDKLKFVCDSADMVVLRCINLKEGNRDVTDKTVFYVDGKPIEGNVFKTSVSKDYGIIARYEKTQSEEKKIVAQKEFSARSKVFAEDFTSTRCHACPRFIFLLEDAVKTGKVVGLGIHNGDPFASPETGVLFRMLNVRFLPTLIIDRNKSKEVESGGVSAILEYLKDEAKVGIAMEVKAEGDNIVADVKIAGRETVSGIKCVAILAENGLVADQINSVYPEKGNPIKNMVHNHVYRSSYEGKVLGEDISLQQGKPLAKMYKFPIKQYIKENCEVIILVTGSDNTVINVQKAKFGEKIGY